MKLAYYFEINFKKKKDVFATYRSKIKEKLMPLTRDLLNTYGTQSKMEKNNLFIKICNYIALNCGLDDPTSSQVCIICSCLIIRFSIYKHNFAFMQMIRKMTWSFRYNELNFAFNVDFIFHSITLLNMFFFIMLLGF